MITDQPNAAEDRLDAVVGWRCRPAITARLLAAWLLLILPALALPADYTYTTNNGTITITRYAGPGGAITIPSTINGRRVTDIGAGAFRDCSELTSVILPDTVTDIYGSAFGSCPNLASVVIPNSVVSLWDFAFQDCSALTSLAIPGSVRWIGDWAFDTCVGLTNVTIADGVAQIGYGAFEDCYGLASVRIPDSVTLLLDFAFTHCISLSSVRLPGGITTIAPYAFYDCTTLTNVVLPNGLTTIQEQAFAFCTALRSISIPATVTGIALDAVMGCSNLTAIHVDALNPVLTGVDGVLLDKGCATLYIFPAGKSGTYTVPKSVSAIASYAFTDCLTLRTLCFLSNAPTLGSYVFYGDSSLVAYYLPATIGWGPRLENVPALLWNPKAQTGAADFGVRTNRFGFTISGTPGLVVAVEACANLANPTWLPLQTNTLTSGSCYFTDLEWSNYPSRCYRLRSP